MLCGSGAYGRVYKYTDYVIKCFNEHSEYVFERDTYTRLEKHPEVRDENLVVMPIHKPMNIIKNGQRIGIAFPYMNYRLHDVPFSKDILPIVFARLLKIIWRLHLIGFHHNDIKPDNVMMIEPDTLELSLVDVGLMTRQRGEYVKDFVENISKFVQYPPEIADLEVPLAVQLWLLAYCMHIWFRRTNPNKTKFWDNFGESFRDLEVVARYSCSKNPFERIRIVTRYFYNMDLTKVEFPPEESVSTRHMT